MFIRSTAGSGVRFVGMPSDFGFKVMNAVHRGLLKITGGRIGWEVLHMPVLELTTIGRKRGRPYDRPNRTYRRFRRSSSNRHRSHGQNFPQSPQTPRSLCRLPVQQFWTKANQTGQRL